MTDAGLEPGELDLRIAVDIGGTFTDIVLTSRDGTVKTLKLLSTPQDFSRAVIDGVRSIVESTGSAPQDVGLIFHGMTVATNAILQGQGAKTALVTTNGFRDVLEFHGRRPTLYDVMWRKPRPLVPRRFRYEVGGRITSRGEVEGETTEGLGAVAERLAAEGIESVAVCLINGHLRPEEERRLAGELKRLCHVHSTASVDVTPEPGEFERTSTAVVNAYVGPVVESYLSALDARLVDAGISAPLYVMQSSGGLLRADVARDVPVQLIESGPAAGVIGARELASRLGVPDVISFDMGGTTAKAALLEGGVAFEANEYEVGAGMNSRRGYGGGAGYLVRVPSLDIAEVGAGGGSIIWIDSGGAPRVGPMSAGADPGPACYGLGGTEPTLSDACVVLGYFNPDALAGGSLPIRRDLAERAIGEIATRLQLDPLDVAFGAVEIAISNMTTLVRAVTTQRGRDPRRFQLVAFGGCGPAYAAGLAHSLAVGIAVVPPSPGLFSAVGMLVSQPQHDAVAYVGDGAAVHRISAALHDLESDVRRRLMGEGYRSGDISLSRFVDMRYRDQRGVLRIEAPPGAFTADSMTLVLDELDREHMKTYGHVKARNEARLSAIRVRARCALPSVDVLGTLTGTNGSRGSRHDRQCYFGRRLGLLGTPVIARSDLGETPSDGPVVIEDMDSTVVIPPYARARLDALGNILIDVDRQA